MRPEDVPAYINTDDNAIHSARVRAGIRIAKAHRKLIGSPWSFCLLEEAQEYPEKVETEDPSHRTVVATREEILDLAAKGYNMTMAAEAMGVAKDTFRRCLERNCIKDLYNQAADEASANMVKTIEARLSQGMSFSDVAKEFGVPTSELRYYYRRGVQVLHPVSKEGFGDAGQGPDETGDAGSVHKDGFSKIVSKTNQARMGYISNRPMLVMEGARLLVSTIIDGEGPDSRLWGGDDGDKSVVVPPLDLYYRDGVVCFGRGSVRVIGADISAGSKTNTYQRGDDVYGEAGMLTLFLEGNSTVTVPILTDLPIELRRKMIV